MKKTGFMVLLACHVLLTTAPEDCGHISANCLYCNETTCTKCNKGFCRWDCKSNCTGKCEVDCDMECICGACADGFYEENCSVPCSDTCYTRSCDRYTGACKDGCQAGYCSKANRCKTQCGENCLNKSCDFDCVCNGCTYGKFGNYCLQDCPPACLKCDKTKGTSTRCDKCKDDLCKNVIHCEKGCKNGSYGVDCKLRCENCSICNQLTGECSPQSTDCTQRLPELLHFVWISTLCILIIHVVLGIYYWYKNGHIPQSVYWKLIFWGISLHVCLVINLILVVVVRFSKS